MADRMTGAPDAVSLSDLVGRAVRQEDLPARVERSVQVGAWIGMAAVALYLLALVALHSAIEDPSVKPDFFFLNWGWELVRGAGFLTGGVALPVILGVGVLVGGAWLGFETAGFTLANRLEQLAAVGLLVAGGMALIPLLIVLTVVAMHVVLYAVALVLIICFFFWIVVTMFDQ